MSFIDKIGKAKAKYSAWAEEKEQKEYERMKTQAKLAKEYNKRDAERQEMQKEINKGKEAKFKNSFIGRTIEKVQAFDERINKPSKQVKAKKGKKGKKGKTPKIEKESFNPFGDGDPWA